MNPCWGLDHPDGPQPHFLQAPTWDCEYECRSILATGVGPYTWMALLIVADALSSKG